MCQEIDQILGKNASEKKINETVYGFCAKFPASLKSVVSTILTITVELQWLEHRWLFTMAFSNSFLSP